MKNILALILASCSLVGLCQTKIQKTIPVQVGQKLALNFDYAQLIRVHTWDKKEILIKGDVSINRGEHDSAFELQVNTDKNIITVTSVLKDKQNIPQRIVIKKGDEEFFFKAKDYNDPMVQKFLEENGRQYTYMSNGIQKEITLEIFVPQGMESKVDAKYGLVEIKDFEAPLVVDAQYGGVDATITSHETGELIARTRFGEILTNLDVKFDQGQRESHHDQWTEIRAKPGSGHRYAFESKYGKVYLRKPN